MTSTLGLTHNVGRRQVWIHPEFSVQFSCIDPCVFCGSMLAKWFKNHHLKKNTFPQSILQYLLLHNLSPAGWVFLAVLKTFSRPFGVFEASSHPSFISSSISVKQSLLRSSSSSSYVLLPRRGVLCLFLLYWKAGPHPPLLFEPPGARHLHVPATWLLIEDRLQVGIVVGLIAEEAFVLGGVLRGLRLVACVLGNRFRLLLWTLGERVKVWTEGCGWACLLGAASLLLWKKRLPPWNPICHLGGESGTWNTKVRIQNGISLKPVWNQCGRFWHLAVFKWL